MDVYPENFSCPSEGWEGRHLIIAHSVEGAAITGLGKIIGTAYTVFDEKVYNLNLPHAWKYGIQYQKDFEYEMENFDNLREGQLVVFVNCKNISIYDITICSSTSWCLFFHGCENIDIRGYKAFNKHTWANTDGLDIDTCKNVIISDCMIDTGDDAIAIRCDSERLKNGKTTCENITIANCILSSSSSIFRIGVGSGLIRDLLISNIIISHGGPAFDLSTHYGASGHALIQNIAVSNVMAKNVSTPFLISAYEDCYVKNISFLNYNVESVDGGYISADDGATIEDIYFSNMHYKIIPAPFEQTILKSEGNNHLFSIVNAKDVRIEGLNTDISEGLEALFKDKFSVFNSDIKLIEN